MTRSRTSWYRGMRPLYFAIAVAAAAAGCGEGSTTGVADASANCALPAGLLADGGPGVDGIPALTDPRFVSSSDPGAAYVRDNDRVIGLHVNGEYLAVPLNIGWWHEVVNLNRGSIRLSVTHCPLTGSSLVFDRSAVNGAEFGVSGLLFMNNLMLYDRNDPVSLWPQMARGARCGTRTGTSLPMFASVEMSWLAWRTLHPETVVVSSETGHERNYRSYPYGSYDVETNPLLLGPNPALDGRRPPKERVLGIVTSDGATAAVPFGALRALGASAAFPLRVGSESLVIFWDRAGEAATAFVAQLNGTPLTFRAENGRFLDNQTGSTWNVDGVAVAGASTGARLAWASDSFVAYWFAWVSFHPATTLWAGAA